MAEQRAIKPPPDGVREGAGRENGRDARAVEQPWRAVFEATLDGIFVVDDQRRFVDANPAACAFFGRSREELLTLRPADLSAPGQDSAAAWKSFRAAGHLERTWRYRRADGAIREAELRSVANFIAGRHLAVVRDVTEQRQAERALQDSEERFRLAFDNAPIGMSLCALDGRWLKVNRALCDLTGYAEHELLQLTFQDITHPEDVDADLEFCRRLVAGEIERYSMEKRYFHKLGHVVWILLHASIARSEEGEPLYFVGQMKDIGDRKRAEDVRRLLLERVMSAQEDERRRIASELHDQTGQLLTSLLVGLRTVEDAPSLQLAQQRAGRLGEIAGQALDGVGRLARDLHPSVLQDLGLGPALTRFAAEHGELLGITIRVKTTGLSSRRLPAAVETSLYRIAQEAIANVGKHARAKRARVSVRRTRKRVELEVQDDGCGFEVERALPTATAAGRLGLHDIRERAALLGGQAAIVSKAGKGTTVCVRIPLRETNAPPAGRS